MVNEPEVIPDSPFTLIKLTLLEEVLRHPDISCDDMMAWMDRLFYTTGWTIYNVQKDWEEFKQRIVG